MNDKAGEGVSGERTLEERLREFRELQARLEKMLPIAENVDGAILDNYEPFILSSRLK